MTRFDCPPSGRPSIENHIPPSPILEIIRRRCEEFDDLRQFPGKDIDNLMVAFSEKYMEKPS